MSEQLMIDAISYGIASGVVVFVGNCVRKWKQSRRTGGSEKAARLRSLDYRRLMA